MMRIVGSLTLGFLILGGSITACSDDDSKPSGSAGSAARAGSGGKAGVGGTSGSGGKAGTGGSAASGGGGSGGKGGTAGSGGSAGTDGGGTAGTDGGDASDAGTMITKSTGQWVVYVDPYGDGGGANPISSTIMGTAEAFALPSGGMRLVLSVTGLPPNRGFGSHLHKLACENNKAGGHYQNNPFPDGGSANDPTYANSTNEAWLDFTTNASGAGSAETTVAWRPRAGEANAIVIHDMMTMDGGIAGAKLACTNMPF